MTNIEREKEKMRRAYALIDTVAEDAARLVGTDENLSTVLAAEAMRLACAMENEDIQVQIKHTAILLRMLFSILYLLVEAEMDQEENPSEEG